MANELAKFLNSQRRHRDELAVNKQVKIAKAHGLTTKDKVVKNLFMFFYLSFSKF